MNSNKIKNIILILALISVVLLSSVGCGTKTASIPFCELDFNDSFEDMSALYGMPPNETESYLGTSYCYPSGYMDKDSELRVTFDDENKISGFSWVYESEDADDIVAAYKSIESDLTQKYGQTTEAASDPTQLSNIWRLDTGNITLAAVISSDYNGLMYTYISPEHSHSTEDIK